MKKPTTNILDSEKVKAFPLRLGTGQGFLLKIAEYAKKHERTTFQK